MHMTLNDLKNTFMIHMDDCLDVSHHVYLKDPQGRYLECNDAQARAFGLSTGADVLGKTDRDFIKESEYHLVQLNDQMIIKQLKPQVLLESATFQKQATQPVLSYKIPLHDTFGKVIGVMGTSIILTDEFLQPALTHPKFHPNHKDCDDNFLKKVNKISMRERECLQLLACGMTAKHIGRKLNLSSRTVEFYIENMKRKFNCANRIELVAKIYPLIKS